CVFVLCFYVTVTNLDGIQFICSNASKKYLPAACLGIEIPLLITLYDRNRKWPILISNRQKSSTRIFGIDANMRLFLSLFAKRHCTVFVVHGIFGRNKILAARSENSEECS